MTRLTLFHLSLGLALGFILGLRLALSAAAGSPRQITPQELAPAAQAEYQILVAQAFTSTGDLQRAVQRLRALGHPADPRALTDLAQQLIAQQERNQQAIDLVRLAAVLMNQPPSPEAQPSPGTAAPAPQTTSAELPATPTPALQYQLVDQQSDCSAASTVAMLKVQVLDARGTPVPGVRFAVTWDEGRDQFVTGLQPAANPGYADLVLTPQIRYNLALQGGAAPLYELAAPECASGAGVLSLTFQAQP